MLKNLKNSTTLVPIAPALSFERIGEAATQGRAFADGMADAFNQILAARRWDVITTTIDNMIEIHRGLQDDIRALGLTMAKNGAPEAVCLAFGEAAFTRLDEVIKQWLADVEAAALEAKRAH